MRDYPAATADRAACSVRRVHHLMRPGADGRSARGGEGLAARNWAPATTATSKG